MRSLLRTLVRLGMVAVLAHPVWAAARSTEILTLGLDLRLRYELFAGNGALAPTSDPNGYLLVRLMPRLDYHVAPDWRLFVQARTLAALNQESRTRPTDRDDYDLHQLYLEWSSSARVRVGRQELTYGSGRLVSARDGPNARLSFDAVQLRHTVGHGWIDAFYSRPVETLPGVLDDASKRRNQFWGAYSFVPDVIDGTLDVDFYYLGLYRDSARFDLGRARELRHSLGSRFSKTLESGFDFNVESVLQFGSFGARSVLAWTAASDVGFRIASLPLQPRIGLKVDYASGDRNRSDSTLQTFNPLFPKGTYFEGAAVLGPYNFYDVHPGVEFALIPKRLTQSIDWDWYWRASRVDGVYGVPGNIIVSGASGGPRFVGQQFTLATHFAINPQLSADGAYTRVFPGAFLRSRTADIDLSYLSFWINCSL